MVKRIDDDDEAPRIGWWGRFIRGMMVAFLVCGFALAVLSLYVLPPPEPPPEPPAEPADEAAAAGDGAPQMIAGIEVSSAPAYSSAAPEAPEEIGPIELSGPALTVNAAAFEADPGTPLVAVVLDDTAADPLLHSALFALDLRLTVGVVAGKEGDRVTAKAAWDAGFEVVAELPLVAAGQGGGVMLEYALAQEEAAARAARLIRRLPMAVAASRPLAAATPPDPAVLNGIDSALAPHGFGYVDHGVAVAGDSTAAAAGLIMPLGVSRFTVPAGASAAEAHSVLDLAAADAAQRGAAVVVAAPGEELFLALQLWGGEGSEGVAKLAPLSAVIKRQSGDASGLVEAPRD